MKIENFRGCKQGQFIVGKKSNLIPEEWKDLGINPNSICSLKASKI